MRIKLYRYAVKCKTIEWFSPEYYFIDDKGVEEIYPGHEYIKLKNTKIKVNTKGCK